MSAAECWQYHERVTAFFLYEIINPIANTNAASAYILPQCTASCSGAYGTFVCPQRALYEDRKTGQKKAPYNVYNRTIKGACGNKLRAPYKCRKSPQNSAVATGVNSRGNTPRAHAKQSILGAIFSRLLFPAPCILCKELLIRTF